MELYICSHVYYFIFIYLKKKRAHTFDTYNIHGEFNKFPDFFVQEFKIVIDS